jgi:AraC family transcriptional regulator
VSEVTTKDYAERINQVIDYIHQHLFEDLSVDQLSRVANFSKFHFHRQFTEYTGITVCKLIQLMRLKCASYQLVFNPHCSIIDIAMDAGFANSESFSRAFKKAHGQTPSQFRCEPAWKPWLEKYQFQTREGQIVMQVQMVDFEETPVAALQHYGPSEQIYNTVRQFIDWRRENKLSPKVSKTYNILYDTPEMSGAEFTRMDICASITRPVEDNALGVVSKVIPAGRCAVVRHLGNSDDIAVSVRYLYAKWLPDSAEQLRDFPCFFHRVNLLADVAEHELITDVYLPLI